MSPPVNPHSGYARGLIEASLDPLVTISPDGKIMDVNSATEEVTGRPRRVLIGSDFSEYFTEPDKARAGYRQVFSTGQVRDYPLAIRHVSGRVTDVLYNATVYHDEEGRIAGVFAAARDVSSLNRSREELERTNREIVTLSQMTDLLQSCQSAEESFPIISATIADLFPGSSGAGFLLNEATNLCELVTTWGESAPDVRVFEPDDCWALRRGHVHSVGMGQSLNPYCDHVSDHSTPYVCAPLVAQGKALGILHLRVSPQASSSTQQWERRLRLIQTATDSISLALANLQLRESLASMAIRDPLTGLFNRRFMEETLDREVSRAARTGRPLVLAMIDLDHFKEFNDEYGHVAGDRVLKAIAAELRRFRHGSDSACRYGGEEFMLIMPEIDLAQALSRLAGFRARLAAQDTDQVPGRGVTFSVGVACHPIHGSTPIELIEAADRALYEAKEQGRDRIVVADEVYQPPAAEIDLAHVERRRSH